MAYLDIGTQGAKRQSFERNPRQLLKSIIDRLGPNEAEVFAEFSEKVESDREYLESIKEYWFANNYHALVKRAPDGRRPASLLDKKKAEFRAKLESHIKREANLLMLNTIMPNGHTLAETTFGECLRLGGLYAKIGKSGKANQLVGKHLTNAQLKTLQNIK